MHSRTLEEIVKPNTGLNKNADVVVGQNPRTISISFDTKNTIYVANSGSDSVSIIDGTSNKLIKEIILEASLYILFTYII